MKQGKPLVSVLTITYNRADLIHKCIESIQRQTYPNYEHVIVDGGSTDDTEEVVMKYHDSHIRYVKLKEKGPAIQMNRAFAESKGEMITFLDDDDEYLPMKISKQVERMEELGKDYGMVYCWMSYYNTENTPPPTS